jgi:DeoR family fructose operon transcriptional repressor
MSSGQPPGGVHVVLQGRGTTVYALERRRQIVASARRDGQVAVVGLAEQLSVAQETIRRDLADLERQGLLRRVHGGAFPAERISFEGDVAIRTERNPEEKARIGQRAVAEAEGAEVIYIDEGSTPIQLARALDPDRPLTVVTSSIPVITAVHMHPQISTILLGGAVRSRSMATTGDWTARMLAELVIDVAFVGTNGFTIAHGLTCPDLGVAAVKRAAISAARRSVLIADSARFGTDSFACFATVSDVDTVITGANAPRKIVDTLRQRRVHVVLV